MEIFHSDFEGLIIRKPSGNDRNKETNHAVRSFYLQFFVNLISNRKKLKFKQVQRECMRSAREVLLVEVSQVSYTMSSNP